MAIRSLATVADLEGAESQEFSFLPILGHDLRSPLTALKGRLQLMHRRFSRQHGREADLNDLARAMHFVERMQHQLDIVRDAAYLKHHRLELQLETADLGPLVRRIATHCGAATARGSLAFDVPDEPIIGRWDVERLGHAIAALVSNAFRFGPEGQEVCVRLTRDRLHARIEVEDSGIGVPPADRELIFQLGRCASNAERSGGAGLGLYVAREIVVRHGGTIGCEARPTGGSTFRVLLPLASQGS